MRSIRFLKSAFAAVRDPERDFTERVFLILTFMSEITVFIAFIGDLIYRENFREIVVLISTLIFVPVFVLVCLRFEKLKIAINVIVFGLVFVILPALFFFGGGLKGGGVIWIIFAFMYVGLVLRGKLRTIMFLLITLLTMGCYLLAYYHPEWVYQHSQKVYYIDSFISLVLVGVLCFVMTWSQGLILSEENKRAQKEAERAEELTRAQNRFFSSMSHEIRTPINSILGLNELILRDESASEDVIRDAAGIQGSGKMLLALINDILDFSKMEAGSMDIVPVDYRIGDMLSEIVNMMWVKAHDKGLEFEVSVDPSVPMVLYGDEVRIKQVLVNLINNAVKYTDKGHVGLRVESTDIDEDTVELMISVSDTGMGIRKEDIPYLFDTFKRVDEGKNRHIEGTGLGLSIVRQLAELMEGTVTVNSVYGEGSTFTVSIRQTVSDHTMVGELNIHNQQKVKWSAYESSFTAPEAKILIVDDNEMNLMVESRLLQDTGMGIDTAANGREALDKCLKTHYDAIFMDHLMPVMDGIECLQALRDQEGGLNRRTPVIVLTANAGSDNKELYNRSGFDGYLVKPVSGEAMEEILIRYLPGDKLIIRKTMMGSDEEIHTSDRYANKAPVIITSSNMCDLPDALIQKLHIPIIPFLIHTDEGVFRDGFHMDANELIRHVNMGRKAVSSPPTESDYTAFFASVLRRTHHIIHISLTSGMSDEYRIASEAAGAFDNVTVVNSECLSSATGILVLVACKLAQQGMSAQEIVSELDTVKHRLKCSFVIDNTDFMVRKGLVSKRFHKIAKTLNIHPSLRLVDDRAGLGGVWIGSTKYAYRRYIHRAIPVDTIPDADIAFVTYADVPEDTLKWIEEEIQKTAYFEHIVFQQASAAISSNCGPGTFGILYFLKSNKSYNLASYFDDMIEKEAEEASEYLEDTDDDSTDDITEGHDEGTPADAAVSGVSEPRRWYDGLAGIDAEAAIANSGSEEAFREVLKVFHDSVHEKHTALESFYSSGDWESYTIKVHALKSSARLIGALELGDKAERLENAGKERDEAYIKEHHASVMEDYLRLKEELDPLYEDSSGADGKDADNRPPADAAIMEGVYEGLSEAAQAMDCDMVEDILKEMEGYVIPDEEKERFEKIREKADRLDYDGMITLLVNDKVTH